MLYVYSLFGISSNNPLMLYNGILNDNATVGHESKICIPHHAISLIQTP